MAHPPHPQSDAEHIEKDRNTARFCVENLSITWVLLAATVLWGIYGYYKMPKRKDPEIPIIRSAVVCPWPGVSSEKVEQQVTRKIEQKIAENVRVNKIESITRSNVSIIIITLEQTVKDPGKQWDDINLKLDSIRDLPEGAGPIVYLRDFGDTAALMLTVASPKVGATEIAWRAANVRSAIQAARAKARPGPRSTGIVCFPVSVGPEIPRQASQMFLRYAEEHNRGRNLIPIEGPGFVGVDGDFGEDDKSIIAFSDTFFSERLRPSEFHPDTWPPIFIRDINQTQARLTAAAGDKYSLHELDEFTELIQPTLQAVPEVSKASRAGVLKERIYLEYSQERLASFGIQPSQLQQILASRNAIFPGGLLEVGGKNMLIDPSGEFRNEKEIGDVLIGATPAGVPFYLRDGVDIYRGYETPPLYLNYYNWRDASGQWHRNRAITLSIQMRGGLQVAEFGRQVDKTLDELRSRLPDDLILARTSDQPLQVQEIVGLFMQTLAEAVVLVVLLALIGFWEWRSALLMAISIPLTLAMTFGFMHLMRIDVEQVSIASLIIALGLLVDDPVVAIDAIKRELDHGHSRLVAAWLGPTKLATAILFATITNIVAYLPMLLIAGGVGNFVYSLPIVLASSLVSSRIVSMTFIPLLGYYLLRPANKPELPMAERRKRGFASVYYRLGGSLIEHRKMALALSMLVLVVGAFFLSRVRVVFFPKDLSYLSFADVWLPEDANIANTDQTARTAEGVIRRVAENFGKEHPDKDGKPRKILTSLTTFVGGGGPRFWFSVAPELLQPNYAQIIIQVNDKHDTEELVAPLQHALSAEVAGARVDVRQLETSEPIGVPVQIRISGEDEQLLRANAERLKEVFRAIPEADRIHDNWGAATFSVKLRVDPDRANLSGITNRDVAISSAGGMSGLPLTNLRRGQEQIPVVSRLRINERARLADVENLYVYSFFGSQKVPLLEVSSIQHKMETEKIQRRNQFRTIIVGCFPIAGVFPSEIMDKVRPQLAKFSASLPPGYKMEIGGEEEERLKGFGDVVVVLLVSTILIFLALVFQFKSAVKPIIVFAAIPYGMVGALIALSVMNSPFGFIAFLGIASLIGVIVSHVIVLFDFIEEAHAAGEPLKEALLDAGILRLRPVLITVGATVIALFPLAAHGGPLWEPLCYTQIGGLILATFVTLLLVPILYAIFVLDLKIVKWEASPVTGHAAPVQTV
jgi:multidrug efflux pump subunit AcrB